MAGVWRPGNDLGGRRGAAQGWIGSDFPPQPLPRLENVPRFINITFHVFGTDHLQVFHGSLTLAIDYVTCLRASFILNVLPRSQAVPKLVAWSSGLRASLTA